jgi:hypothetical protein
MHTIGGLHVDVLDRVINVPLDEVVEDVKLLLRMHRAWITTSCKMSCAWLPRKMSFESCWK